MSQALLSHAARLAALIDRIRPAEPEDAASATQGLRLEAARLRANPDEAEALCEALQDLLTLPHQTVFYAETGVASALGFWLELQQRLSRKLLPPEIDHGRLRDLMHAVFHDPNDHLWVCAASEEAWIELVAAIVPEGALALTDGGRLGSLLEAIRAVSFRLAGTGAGP